VAFDHREAERVISLYDHQEEAIIDLRASVIKHKRSLLVAATGFGKTRVALRLVQGAVQQRRSVWFIVHRRELCKQTSREFWKGKVEHGLIMAGKAQTQVPVQIGTVLTCAKRVETWKKPDIIIIDEAHRSNSASYQKIIDACPDSIIIGLTATPERTDGRGMDETYNDMVLTKDMRWLIDHGYLSEYKLIAPPVSGIDLTGIKTIAGDYDNKELAERMDKPTITGDAIAAYKKHVNGKRCMVFCVNVKHSKHVCEQYNAAGITAEHIDGTMTDAQREGALDRFRRGVTLVLCTVNLAIEGLDIPAVEAVQMLRPTKSVIVYLQIIGRGLRVEVGKQHCWILDHCENWKQPRFGLPDDERTWSLDARKKGKRKKQDEEADIKTQTCDQCYAVFLKGHSACPQCGAPIKVFSSAPREVEGELVEIDTKALRRERRIAQGRARTIDELVELGMSRNMKRPAQWAAITLASRSGSKPTPADFVEAKAAMARVKAAHTDNSRAF